MDFHCQAGEHQDLCMNSQRILQGDDLEGRPPMRRDEVVYFSLLFFMEYVADTPLTSFMEVYVPRPRSHMTQIMNFIWMSKGLSMPTSTSQSTILSMLRNQM